MGNDPKKRNRRSVVSAVGSGIALAAIPVSVSASSNPNGKNFNTKDFGEVFDYIVEYREADEEEREYLENNLNQNEWDAIAEALNPVKTTKYVKHNGSDVAHENLPENGVFETRNGETHIIVDESERNLGNRWDWDEDTIEEIIKQDSVEELSLDRQEREVNSEQDAGEIGTMTHSSSDSGSESHSYIIEKSNLGGVSTAFRWEHEIEWDWEITDGGGRVSNTRNYSRPLHTTWFLSYDDIIDEETWTEHDGNPWNDNYSEEWHSYLQVRFSQTLPVIGVSNYIAYPYSELHGDGGGFGTTNTLNSGIDD